MGFVDPVRLCTPCSTVTKQEEEFFNTHLKLLFSGVFHKVTNHFIHDRTYSTCNVQMFISRAFFIDLGATFNVSTSVREIESPLSDEVSNDLHDTKEDRKSPAFSTLSTDTEKLSLGKIDCIESSFN